MNKSRFLPVVVEKTEALWLRIFLVLAVLWSIWKPSKYEVLEDPVGLAKLGVPLAWIGKDGVHPYFLTGTAVMGLLYIIGIFGRGRLTLVGLLGLNAAHIGYWTLANSQGNTFHGSQMTSLVLVLQLAGCITMLLRQRLQLPLTPRWPGMDSVLLFFSQCAIAGVYVTSAITKIKKSGGRWLWDSPYFAKSIQKVWKQLHYDYPSKGEFTGVSPWATWLAENPMMARLLFAPGFFLELFAFVILWNRAWAAGWGLALVLMHIGIGFIMQLYFPEFEVLVLIFCVGIPYWLLQWTKGAR